VLAALKDDDAVFAELRGVSQRPRSAYPVHFDLDNPWGIMLPHLLKVKWVCQRLQLKACAELALGKTEDALADVKLMLRMADSVSEEPFLVSFLVRIACVQLATQPVWEGLAEHRWTESQLRELQTHFQRYDFLTDMQRPWNCERAAGTLTADIVRKKGLDVLLVLIGPGQPSSADRKFANWCGGFIPRGWFYFEQVNCCRLYEQQLEGAFDSASKRVWPSRIQANTKALEKEIAAGGFGKTSKAFLRHHVLASLLLPALHKLPMKAAEGQTAADQAALACALERYRLTNGQLPDRLDALAPRFISKLPTDAITGEPYKYHRTEAGQFVLYSVGWDEKNDGGKSGKTLFDDKEGDWVWQYPAK
jgi:hypothetical protein